MANKKIAVLSNGWDSDYIDAVFNGLRAEAKVHGVDLFFFLSYEIYRSGGEYRDEYRNFINLLNESKFDGIISLTNTFSILGVIPELENKIQQSGIPTVTLEYSLKGADFIGTENQTGMTELCRHLFEMHNVRDVLYMGGFPNSTDNSERLEVLKDVMDEYGLVLKDENILCGEFYDIGAHEAMMEWCLAHPGKLPDAIVCANDRMAFGVSTFLHSMGYKIPQDVIVTGFDGISKGDEWFVGMTTVARGREKLGKQALMHLLEKIENPDSNSSDRILSSRLLVRESCGCRLSEDVSKKLSVFQDVMARNSMRKFDEKSQRTFNNAIRNAFDISDDFISLGKNLEDVFNKTFKFGDHVIRLFINEELITSLNDFHIRSGFSERLRLIMDFSPEKLKDNIIYTSDISDLFTPENGQVLGFLTPIETPDLSIGCLVCDNVYDLGINQQLGYIVSVICECFERYVKRLSLVNVNKMLEKLAVRDPLTGFYKSEHLESIVLPHIKRMKDSDTSGVLVVAEAYETHKSAASSAKEYDDLCAAMVSSALRDVFPPDFDFIRARNNRFVICGDIKSGERVAIYINRFYSILEDLLYKFGLDLEIDVFFGHSAISIDDGMAPESYYPYAVEKMNCSRSRYNAKQ